MTLLVLTIITSPALATNFCAKNFTEKPVLFQSYNLDPFDWLSARRPDHNFNNVWLSAGEKYCATWDDKNAPANNPGFNMAITHSRDGAVFNIRLEADRSQAWELKDASSNFSISNTLDNQRCGTGFSYPLDFDPTVTPCYTLEFRR